MLKRFGIIGLLLSASTVLLPAAAFAQDFRREANYSYSGEHRNRQGTEYRNEYRREDRDRDWRGRDAGDRVGISSYYVPAPNYYYAPAPYCNR